MKTKPFWYVYSRRCGTFNWFYDSVFETRELADKCATEINALGDSSAIACIRLPVDTDPTPRIYDAGGAVALEE